MLSPAWLPTMRCASPPAIRCGMNIDARPMTFAAAAGDNGGATAAVAAGGIGLAAWQGWGTSSPVRSMVVDVIEELRMLVKDLDSKMSFGGLGGKLQGDFRIQEDKKHRTNTKSLYDSEDKLQFFAVQQIACRRLLGSGGYLCQRCWLALEDCMCSKLMSSSLWHGTWFWLYMHPKDFLRQNNTGKLLWQVFGVQAATCAFLESMNMKKLCGISLSTRENTKCGVYIQRAILLLPQFRTLTTIVRLYLMIRQCLLLITFTISNCYELIVLNAILLCSQMVL